MVAVVTGASKGIGASIAKHLADEGAAVVVNYASSKQGADRVVAEITGKGGRAVAVQADTSKPADIKRLFAEAKTAFGRIDSLGPRNVRVNAINPGMVETEGFHAAGVAGSDMRKQYEAQAPLGRIGQPEDIAPPWSSWRRRIRAGSPARHCTSRADTGSRRW
jgi:NAD(P)-dependent dehydrogenase (short-subunit alcohol dehydrogenase family)